MSPYCSVEHRNVPAGEVKADPKWGEVHQTKDGWHTLTGTPVPEPGDKPRKGGTVPNLPGAALPSDT